MKYRIPTKNEWRMKDTASSDRCWWWLASLFMAFTLVLIAASCQEETVQAETVEEGLPATVRLEVMPDATSQAQTRADENAIKDLHVLVYNNRRELIGKGYNNNSPTIIVKTRSGSGCTIYAIANTGNAKLFDGGVAVTEAKLKTMKTAAIGSWDALTTASHLIMVGSKTGVAINAGSSTLKDGIAVTRMVGKVTLNIGVKTGSGITIKDYQVFSLPRQSNYVPHATTDGATTWINGVLTPVNTTAASKMFFMYENRRGIVSSITNQKDKGEKKAPAYSTYVVINGKAYGYNATWRVYLGESNTSDFNIKRNTPYVITITLSRPGTDGADTRVEVEETYPVIVGGNSNCYMVVPNQSVNIPVERANESFLPIGNSPYNPNTKTYTQLESYTPWVAEIVWQYPNSLVTLSNASGTGYSGSFTVKANASAGNAVVAIKDNTTKKILWSWHIWITDYNGTDCYVNNYNFTFMDRDLGAAAYGAYGLFYQWGRKDPFPSTAQGGGRPPDNTADPTRVFDSAGKAFEVYKLAVPKPNPITTNETNLANAIQNPITFYCNAGVAPTDWYIYDTQNGRAQNINLWGGGSLASCPPKTVFDPCPKGWRVPSEFAFSQMNSLALDNETKGVYARSNTTIWPYAGCRAPNNGLYVSITTGGYHWLASAKIYAGHYYSSSLGGGSISGTNRSMPFGFNVRCVKDNL